MVSMILSLVLAQAGPPEGAAGTQPPVQALAVIDAKGTLAITRVRPVNGLGPAPLPATVELRSTAKGEKEVIVVRAKVRTVTVTTVELSAAAVEAHTVVGKPIAPDKLAELLAKERPVLLSVDGKKVDPFHLQLYKDDTIVLVPPTFGRFWHLDSAGEVEVVPAPLPVSPVMPKGVDLKEKSK